MTEAFVSSGEATVRAKHGKGPSTLACRPGSCNDESVNSHRVGSNAELIASLMLGRAAPEFVGIKYAKILRAFALRTFHDDG